MLFICLSIRPAEVLTFQQSIENIAHILQAYLRNRIGSDRVMVLDSVAGLCVLII